MSIADELSKLEDLRRRGVLNDAEFEKAKAAVLAGGAAAAGDAPVVEHLSAQLAEVRYQNELARLDREWEIEREQYMISGRYGRRHIPTPGASLAGAAVVGVFGVLWTILAFTMMSGFGGPEGSPFGIVSCIFPLFGVMFTVFGVWMGIHAHGKAQKYQEALAAYQRRRAQVRPEQFASQPAEPPRPSDDRFTT
jgi:hypothetical protein